MRDSHVSFRAAYLFRMTWGCPKTHRKIRVRGIVPFLSTIRVFHENFVGGCVGATSPSKSLTDVPSVGPTFYTSVKSRVVRQPARSSLPFETFGPIRCPHASPEVNNGTRFDPFQICLCSMLDTVGYWFPPWFSPRSLPVALTVPAPFGWSESHKSPLQHILSDAGGRWLVVHSI